MMADRHMAGGVGGWLLVAPVIGVGIGDTLLGIPVAMFASLLADLDHSHATMGRNPVGWVVQQFTQHRYETHSIFAGLLVSLVVLPFVGGAIAAAVASGYLIGHIFLDCCTMQGCAIFWPFERKLRRLPLARFVRTNHPSEFITIVVLAIVWMFLEVMRLKP